MAVRGARLEQTTSEPIPPPSPHGPLPASRPAASTGRAPPAAGLASRDGAAGRAAGSRDSAKMAAPWLRCGGGR